MDTGKQKRPRKRPYTRDLLTRQGPSGNWVIQFRVPQHLHGKPPFGERTIFKKSLKTKDRNEAIRLKEQFLRATGYYEADEDASDAAFNRAASPRDQYWTALGSVDPSGGYDDLTMLAQELRGQIQEVHEEGRAAASQGRLQRLEAQLAAVLRLRDERTESAATMAETPHAYEVDLASAVDRYAAEMAARGLRAKTVGKLRTAFVRFKAFCGRVPELRSIRKALVSAYIRERREAGLSRATVANDLTFLGAAFAFAQEQGYLSDSIANPFREHRLSGFAAGSQRQQFTRDQVVALLQAAADDHELMAAIYLGYYTGMRISELFSCTLAGEGDDQVWQVATLGGKTIAATRIVPVSPYLQVALSGLGFMPEAGKAVPWTTTTDQAIGKRFGRMKVAAMKKLGIEVHAPYTFHSLRHGFVTALLEAGYNELEVADLSGHSKGSTARTEAGRSYFRNQQLPKLKEMIGAIAPLPSPSEIVRDLRP